MSQKLFNYVELKVIYFQSFEMHLLYERLILLSLVLFRGSLSFNVVGYMPEWRHEGADFDRLCQHLTHLIFFSLEMTPKGEVLTQ